jgi:hypothetical protein
MRKVVLAVLLLPTLTWAGQPSGNRLISGGPRPACDAVMNGAVWYIKGTGAEPDIYARCIRGANDVYDWVQEIAPTPKLKVFSVGPLVWTDQPEGATFFNGSTAYTVKVDLTLMTEVRLRMQDQSATGNAGSRLYLVYKAGDYSSTVRDYAHIGTSEVWVPLDEPEGYHDTDWITLADGARSDVYVALVGTNGDGVKDPAIGTIFAEFR